MKPLTLIAGFLPWIAFSLISTRVAADGVAWSALIAVAITIVAMAAARPAWPPKILNVGFAGLFGIIAIVGFAGGPGVDQWLYTWAAPGSASSSACSCSPPAVPAVHRAVRQGVDAPRLLGLADVQEDQSVLSSAWGVAITVMGLASIAVSALGERATSASRDSLLELFLNWVVPIGVIWFMVKFTATYPDKVTGRDGATATDVPAPSASAIGNGRRRYPNHPVGCGSAVSSTGPLGAAQRTPLASTRRISGWWYTGYSWSPGVK